jgi:hypothetical protein
MAFLRTLQRAAPSFRRLYMKSARAKNVHLPLRNNLVVCPSTEHDPSTMAKLEVLRQSGVDSADRELTGP